MVSLLDTATLLWTLVAPERLSDIARERIAKSVPMLSVASYWEIVIKSRKGLLPIADPVDWWTRATALLGSQVLPIGSRHVTQLAALPDLHRDPFDRILIAQALVEGMELISSDRQISRYPVRIIW